MNEIPENVIESLAWIMACIEEDQLTEQDQAA